MRGNTAQHSTARAQSRDSVVSSNQKFGDFRAGSTCRATASQRATSFDAMPCLHKHRQLRAALLQFFCRRTATCCSSGAHFPVSGAVALEPCSGCYHTRQSHVMKYPANTCESLIHSIWHQQASCQSATPVVRRCSAPSQAHVHTPTHVLMCGSWVMWQPHCGYICVKQGAYNGS